MCSPAISQMTPELKEAVELHKAGKVKEAVDVYAEVIKKNPRSAEALNWRGMAYDDLGQLDKALADYDVAIDLSSNYADAYNNRGEIYRKQKKYAEALADYKKAAELEKAFAEAHYNMALIHELQQRKEQAVAEYAIYLRLKPDAPDKPQVTGKIQGLKQAMVKDRMAAGQAGAPGQPPAPAAPGQVKPGEQKPGAQPAPPKFGAPGMPAVPKAPGVDLGIPGVPPLPIPTDVDKLIAGMDIASSIFSFLFYVFTSLMLYLIANKTGTSLPWLAFIPIANIFLMVKVARKPLWWMALLFLPVVAPLLALLGFIDPTGGIIVAVLIGAVILVTIAAWLLVSIGIAQARGKSVIWGILLFIPCTYLIALGYLGLSK
jgi:tetratricopeptide (TPR) repeat protein